MQPSFQKPELMRSVPRVPISPVVVLQKSRNKTPQKRQKRHRRKDLHRRRRSNGSHALHTNASSHSPPEKQKAPVSSDTETTFIVLPLCFTAPLRKAASRARQTVPRDMTVAPGGTCRKRFQPRSSRNELHTALPLPCTTRQFSVRALRPTFSDHCFCFAYHTTHFFVCQGFFCILCKKYLEICVP